jgi:hypothetical protein
LRHNFFRLYLTFVLLAVLGLAAVALTARMAIHSLAQPRMLPMFLLAQAGLFLMLLIRFWQRGAETIIALDSPISLPIEPVVAPVEPSHTPAEHEGIKSNPGEGASEFTI